MCVLRRGLFVFVYLYGGQRPNTLLIVLADAALFSLWNGSGIPGCRHAVCLRGTPQEIQQFGNHVLLWIVQSLNCYFSTFYLFELSKSIQQIYVIVFFRIAWVTLRTWIGLDSLDGGRIFYFVHHDQIFWFSDCLSMELFLLYEYR